MRVIIKGLPKEKAQYTRINPFDTPDEYKYGGRLQNRGSQNGVPIQAVDTYSDFLRQPNGQGYQESPYHSTGKQLKEAPEYDKDTIIIEKQEQVMGDFNGDGMPVLMGTNVGSHESGNDLRTKVPNGSFVFSDTPSLKIKDIQVLDMFGKKKAMTPAQVAKQYDLQRYKKVIDDPNRDSIDKNTAKLMYGNMVNKLNTLASVQEQMKQDKDSKRQQSIYKEGGWAEDPVIPYAPTITGEQAYLQAIHPDAVGLANTIYGPPATNSFIDGMDGPRTELVRNLSNGRIPEYIEPLPYVGTNMSNTSPIAQQMPVPDYSTKQPQQTRSTNLPRINGVSPDTLAAITAGLRYAQYPNYNPVRQVAHGAIPQAVYADPTRAKAAIQEAANSAANNIAMGANGPVARANILALQGKAGAESANIEAQYAQRNTEIANRTNEQAAQVYNQLWKDQQGYNKDYAEEVHNAQMDKLGYQFGVQNELLKQAYQADNRKRTAQNYNYINPYYTMDSRGYIYPKSEEQLKAVRAIGNSPGSGSNNSGKELELYKKLYDQAIAQHIDPVRADKWAAAESGMLKRSSSSYESNNPMNQKVKVTGDYDNEYKRGGYTKMKILALPSK